MISVRAKTLRLCGFVLMLCNLVSPSTLQASGSEMSLEECLEEFARINRPEPAAQCQTAAGTTLPGLTLSFSANGANCTPFIQNDGSYGRWGQIAEEYLKSKGDDSPYFSDDLTAMAGPGGICPRWAYFDKATKIHFWVWTLAAMAWKEATCLEDARNANATNGVAVGLLQLDEKKSARSWRGPNCRVKNVSAANENIRCGMDILEELLQGKSGEYKSNGRLYGRGSNSYWEQLRRTDGDQMGVRIREFPLCN